MTQIMIGTAQTAQYWPLPVTPVECRQHIIGEQVLLLQRTYRVCVHCLLTGLANRSRLDVRQLRLCDPPKAKS